MPFFPTKALSFHWDQNHVSPITCEQREVPGSFASLSISGTLIPETKTTIVMAHRVSTHLMHLLLLFCFGNLYLFSLPANSQITVTPTGFEFAPQQIGMASAPQDFVITNEADTAVTLHPGHIAITSAEDRLTELSVLSYNIEFDKRDWPGRLAYMLEGFREYDIDILGLQEVIQREHLENQAKTIADSLGFYYYFDSVDDEGRTQRYGNAIVSRYPIEETNFRALEPLDAFRKVVHVRVSVDGQSVDVYNTHLHNPPDAGETRKEQIRDLLDFVEQTSSGGVMFLTGDFNAAPDWPEMELVYEAFTDVYPIFHENHLDPEHSTLNPRLGFPERRIDYVFFNDDGAGDLIPLSAKLILDDEHENDQLENDHFGVLARFNVSWDTGDFGLNNIDEPVELEPGGQATVSVTFKPQSTGEKEVLLQAGDAVSVITGEAFDATVTRFPFFEDFSDAEEFSLPFGWSTNAGNWYVFNSNNAGGTAPELVFWWEPVQEGRFYVNTPPMRTTGLDSLSVSFRHRVDNFGDPGTYDLQLVSIAGDDEFLVMEWNDPESIPAEEITARLYRGQHGVGHEQLRLAWVFDGPSDNIVRWAIDDVEVGAEPTLVVTPEKIEFGLLQMGEVSDSMVVTLTNIGGGLLEITPDDIRLTGEHPDQYLLNNISETVLLASEDSVFVSVAFSPDKGGEMTARLSILDEHIHLTGQVFDPTSHMERYLQLNLMRGGASDNSEFSRVPNPAPDDVNNSEEVVRFYRSQHGVPWGGFFAFLPVPLDLSEKKYIYVDVWKPRISPIRFKVEDGPTPDLEIESMFPQTKTEQWETVVFDFSEKDGEWNIIAFMPDFANPVDLDEDIVIYFANIRLGDEPDITSTDFEADLPSEFGLDQNYPNPFNPSTNIVFQLPVSSRVTLEVYDVIGRRVVTLVDDNLDAGYHEVTFDGTRLASGVYLYRMQAGEFVRTRKLMLVK
ncbi:MAG: choice-of-anchor D domain-containing protein [Balneolaceae bacterium]|nr:MAG: choice-of-anchor D domain-containing protein [Balneolaceae bacterium]